jgi:hypothetical protein
MRGDNARPAAPDQHLNKPVKSQSHTLRDFGVIS